MTSIPSNSPPNPPMRPARLGSSPESELQPTMAGDRLRFTPLARKSGMNAHAAAAVAAPTPPEAYSEIPIRRDLLPGTPAMPDKSDIPGYTHLQCGEFAYKYFHLQGRSYPTLGQPYNYLMTGEPWPAGTDVTHYKRYFNNGATQAGAGTVPPRAGDILVAKGPGGGEFHTAIVTKVEGDKVHIIQANVPHATQDLVETTLPMKFENGHYFMPALPTSQLGYKHDFDVVGWIHPTGPAALPGADG